MNHVFRIVWSRALHAWVVASELIGRHGKGRGRSVAGAGQRSLVSSSSPWSLRLGVLAGLAMLYGPAHATDRYWDVNQGTVGSGGTGNWDTTQTYWNARNDGVGGPFGAWNNAAFDNAIFAGTAGTVTVGTVTANRLTFTV